MTVRVWRQRRDATDKAVEVHQHLPQNPSAWDGWRKLRVVRREYEDRAHTLCSFYLEPVDGDALPPFEPGQFLTLKVELGEDQALIRCYSLSDGPNAKSYRISVKRVLASNEPTQQPAGVGSNQIHDKLQIGDIINAKAPAGRFVVKPEPNVPIVLIAGGVGITPLLSMLRGGLAADPSCTVYLYYGVRGGAEHGFREELEELARLHPTFHLNVVYGKQGPDDVSGRDYQHTGKIDLELLRRTLPAGRHRFYVCGPPAMMASLIPALGQWGVPPEDIHHEAFGPSAPLLVPTVKIADAAPAFEILFSKSARTLVWDGADANLLELARRHNVSVESGCRAGICGSCEVKLVAGTVHYTQPPSYEITPGHCLLCIGIPDSALEIEA